MRLFVSAALVAVAASVAVATPIPPTCDCIIETPEGPKPCCPVPTSTTTSTHLTIVPPRLPTGGFSSTKSHHKTATTSQSISFHHFPTPLIPIPINPTTGKPLKK